MTSLRTVRTKQFGNFAEYKGQNAGNQHCNLFLQYCLSNEKQRPLPEILFILLSINAFNLVGTDIFLVKV